MSEHVFGGEWTRDKLERVRKYLQAYTTIFHGNERAAHFTTSFVDAFAGTGDRKDSSIPGLSETPLLDVESDDDLQDLQKGSARIALEVEPSFDRYIFIEHKEKELRNLRNCGRSIRNAPPVLVSNKETLILFCRDGVSKRTGIAHAQSYF